MLTEGGAQVRGRSGVPATCTLHSLLATRLRSDPQILTLEGGAAAGKVGGCRGSLGLVAGGCRVGGPRTDLFRVILSLSHSFHLSLPLSIYLPPPHLLV